MNAAVVNLWLSYGVETLAFKPSLSLDYLLILSWVWCDRNIFALESS